MKVPTKEEIASRKADRERRKGAPLSVTEELWLFIPGKEGLDNRRADPRDVMQKMADEQWSVVMAKDEANSSSVSDELARVEAQIAKSQRDKAFAGLDSAGQYAAILREKHEAELSARATEQQYAEHLERNAEPIKRLQALQTEMAWCADYHAGDLAAVERALRQYSTPGACQVEAKRLMDEAVACKERFVKHRTEELAVKESELRKARHLLDQQLAELKSVKVEPLDELDTSSDEYWRRKEALEVAAGLVEPGHYIAPLEV
jgi:hypothetical protein